MKIKVMYYSRGGNTKKVADAIAQTFNQTAESVPPAYPLDNVKLLFLGSAVYGNKIDSKMEEFIRTLTDRHVKNVALFGTSGNSGNEAGAKMMKELFQGKGINVIEESFFCDGQYFLFFNRKHPSAEELKNAQEFAEKIADRIKE